MSNPVGVPGPTGKRPAWATGRSVRYTPGGRTARFLNRSFPQSYAAVSLLPRLGSGYLWLRRLERAGAGRRLDRLSICAYRKSDTVFVFGTGASINDYPPEYWELVRDHDSIGMNFFLLHEHVPTFHVMENVSNERKHLLRIRYAEHGDYKNTPLIIKTQLTNLSANRVRRRIGDIYDLPPEVRVNAYLSLDLLAAGDSVNDMVGAYRLTEKLGLWRPKPHFLLLTKRRGSVAYIVNFAVRAGYRRIVLCGVDLNHPEHFYEVRRHELESAGLPVPLNDETGPVHGTNDPSKHPVVIHDVLLAMKDSILDPAGIELLVGSETSALYPDLSCFNWAEAIG